MNFIRNFLQGKEISHSKSGIHSGNKEYLNTNSLDVNSDIYPLCRSATDPSNCASSERSSDHINIKSSSDFKQVNLSNSCQTRSTLDFGVPDIYSCSVPHTENLFKETPGFKVANNSQQQNVDQDSAGNTPLIPQETSPPGPQVDCIVSPPNPDKPKPYDINFNKNKSSTSIEPSAAAAYIGVAQDKVSCKGTLDDNLCAQVENAIVSQADANSDKQIVEDNSYLEFGFEEPKKLRKPPARLLGKKTQNNQKKGSKQNKQQTNKKRSQNSSNFTDEKVFVNNTNKEISEGEPNVVNKILPVELEHPNSSSQGNSELEPVASVEESNTETIDNTNIQEILPTTETLDNSVNYLETGNQILPTTETLDNSVKNLETGNQILPTKETLDNSVNNLETGNQILATTETLDNSVNNLETGNQILPTTETLDNSVNNLETGNQILPTTETLDNSVNNIETGNQILISNIPVTEFPVENLQEIKQTEFVDAVEPFSVIKEDAITPNQFEVQEKLISNSCDFQTSDKSALEFRFTAEKLCNNTEQQSDSETLGPKRNSIVSISCYGNEEFELLGNEANKLAEELTHIDKLPDTEFESMTSRSSIDDYTNNFGSMSLEMDGKFEKSSSKRNSLLLQVGDSEAGPDIATGLTSNDLKCASEFFREAAELESQIRRNIASSVGSYSDYGGEADRASCTSDIDIYNSNSKIGLTSPPHEERSAPEGTSSPDPKSLEDSEVRGRHRRSPNSFSPEVNELLKKQALDFEEKLLRQGIVAAEKEKELHEMLKEEQKHMQKVTASRDALLRLVEQYKGMLGALVSDKDKTNKGQEEKIKTLEIEKQQALEDLSNVEAAFSDVHRKYERTKQIVDTLRRNEETLRTAVADYEQKLLKQERKYLELQKHAEEKVKLANDEFETLRRSNDQEMTKMSALLKKAEMKIISLQESLDRKNRENQELTQLCDDLISKVGS